MINSLMPAVRANRLRAGRAARGVVALVAAALLALGLVPAGSDAVTYGPSFTLTDSHAVTTDQVGLTPITPVRRVDTRPASQIGPYAGRVDGTPRTFVLTGSGVPSTATAVVVNIVAVSPTTRGYLTLWPSGAPEPVASTLNMTTGVTTTNNATVALGPGGGVQVAVGNAAAYVIIDVQGYYSVGQGGALVPVAPTRVLDTRTGTGGLKLAMRETETRDVQLRGMPANTVGVVANVTTVNASNGGYLTLWPQSASRPNTSNLNLQIGRPLPNLVTTALTNGALSMYNAVGTVDVVIDVQGWIVSTSSATFTAQAPQRMVDTRTGQGASKARLGPGQSITVPVVQSGAGIATMNVTGVNATSRTYLTVWPAGTARPATSNLDLTAGETRPNAVLVPAGVGKVSIYNSSGSVDVVVDTVGSFWSVAGMAGSPAEATSTSRMAQYPATGPGDPAAWAVTRYTDGSTIRWNPCATVHWTADLRYAPSGALADLTTAFDMLSQASGIPFAYDGASSGVPAVSWQSVWPAGQRPFVVAWGRPAGQTGGTDLLPGGGVVGEGGWIARGGGGTKLQIVNGYAVFDASFTGLTSGFGADGRGQLVLHELMHALGLGHTTDSVQQMYPMVTRKPGVLGAGDLNGLKAVGRTQGCL